LFSPVVGNYGQIICVAFGTAQGIYAWGPKKPYLCRRPNDLGGGAGGVARFSVSIVYNATQLVRGQLSKKKFVKRHYQVPKKML